MVTSVAVVDYGMGNLDSVRRALEVCGATVRVTGRPEDLAVADRLVLPGVGAFGAAMDNLRERGLEAALTAEVIDSGAPCLGICLGMQLMATNSSEHGNHEGLGWVAGTVDRLVATPDSPRIPHVGWNEVHPTVAHPLVDGLDADHDFYFVHSFAFATDDPADTLATTPYAGGFTSVVGHSNIVGVQFHPEKSQDVGRRLLTNFLRWEP